MRCCRSSPPPRGAASRSTPGCARTRRRFGAPAGFWLPECAYARGLDRLLAERPASSTSAWIRARRGRPARRCTPALSPRGPSRSGSTGRRARVVGGRLPADPAYLEYHRQSLNGIRLWAIGGGAYDPVAAADARRDHAAASAAAVAARLRGVREPARPLRACYVRDRHRAARAWWTEGPMWLGRALALAPEHGVRLVNPFEALADHEPAERPPQPRAGARARTSRRGTRPRSPTCVGGAQARAAPCCGSLAERPQPRGGQRAARELLAVQASDWAFLD